jgi:hypothetical protein
MSGFFPPMEEIDDSKTPRVSINGPSTVIKDELKMVVFSTIACLVAK